MWVLPWAEARYGSEFHALRTRFPNDFAPAPEELAMPTIAAGDQYAVGSYTDEWGAIFTQATAGIIGEVKEPIITDDTWGDTGKVHVPRERLGFDRDAVREFARSSDRFVVSPVLARPFEQLQFLRGSENLYVDLADPPAGLGRFLETMHEFYCELTEAWAKSDIDGIWFMDDWGAQKSLLINPLQWRELFKPLYKDYIDIAHQYGKRALMHSDGHTAAIYPDLIEMGLDAFNSQLFCIGIDVAEQFAGRITFWGEIDRQYLLAHASVGEVKDAVRSVFNHLWRDGGCIGQCEFGAGARIENVATVFQEWDAISAQLSDG